MADQDLTSLDEFKPDGQVDQVLTLDDSERETRRKLKAWADVEHGLTDGGHTIVVSTTAPMTPTNWQMWFNSETGELLIYHDDYDKWVTVEQPTFNYIYNSSFSRFANATSIPTGWSRYGSSTTGTVTPSGTGLSDTRQKFGPYALAINSGNGQIFVWQETVRPGSMFGQMSYWIGRTVAFGCWVWANTANSTKLVVYGYGGTADFHIESQFHPGDSTWRWLVAVGKINGNPTHLREICHVELASTTAIFSGPTFVEGSWCPHVVPSGLVLRSEVLHVGSANGALDTVPGGTQYYGAQGVGASMYNIPVVAPFQCLISNMRVYISGGAGAGKSYVATLVSDWVDTPMTCTISDTNTFNFDNANKVRVRAEGLLVLKVTGTAGATVGAVRASFLIEEIPLWID